MDSTLIIIFSLIIILAGLVFALICMTKKGYRPLNVEHYRAKCLENEHQLKKDEPTSYHLVVMNADKLVDQALRERGAKGETMAERMKNSSQAFSDRNGIWTAHKLRNMIVHEPDVKVTYEQARKALANFRRALKDLGAI